MTYIKKGTIMTKKTKKTIANAEAKVIASVTGNELRNYMSQYPNASLRRIADSTGISYAWMLKSSKKPIIGEAYDPTAINYDAIASILAKRDISLADLPWIEMNQANARNSIAKLSKDPADFPNGSKWYLRGTTDQFEIVYQTSTNVIIIANDSTVPMNLSWATFFQKGPSIEKRPLKNIIHCEIPGEVWVEKRTELKESTEEGA